MASKKTGGSNEEQIVNIAAKDIIADFAWNARSGDWRADEGTPDDENKGEHSFKGLVKSIKARGQDTAVTVRPSKKAGKFELTAGFRRFAAILEIAKETNNPNPTIKAVVKKQNEAEARAENIRENTARDELKGPDLAWSLHELYKLQTAGGGAPSDSALADEIGKSQPYVSKLLRIMKGVTTKVTDQWRSSRVPVTVNEMASLIGKDKGEQEAEFKRIIESKGGVAGGQGAGGGQGAWLEAAKKKAASLGMLFGRLEKNELIDTAGLSFDTHLDYLLKVNKKATARQRAAVAKAAQKAYDDALNAKDEPKGDESDDDAEE
jgi:ParB/RepB/Spo0J family partition protein